MRQKIKWQNKYNHQIHAIFWLIPRCISVYFPRRDIYSQRRTTKIFISICWMIPILLLSMPLTKTFGSFGLECGTRDCVIIKDDAGRKFLSFLTLVGFLLPVFTLIIANIAIYARVKVRIKNYILLSIVFMNIILVLSLYPRKFLLCKL